MRKLLVLVFSALLSANVIAQDVVEVEGGNRHSRSGSDGDFELALRFGPSFPVGDFGDKSTTNPDAGFAKIGLFYAASIKYKFWDESGMMLIGFHHYNPLDAKSYLKAILAEFPPSVKVKITSDAWKFYGASLGFFNSLDLDGSSCDLKAYLGVEMSEYADIKYEFSEQGVPLGVFNESALSTSGFFFGFGFDFRVPVKDQLNVVVGFDYLLHDALFDNVEFKDESGQIIDSGSYKQPVRTIELSAGVTYTF